MLKTQFAAPTAARLSMSGLVFCALASSLAAPVRAQGQAESPAEMYGTHEEAPRVEAARFDGSIALDGRLDESAWQAVTPATRFIQTEPIDGGKATERTEVYVLYDDDAIYIGARMWDESGPVRSRLGRRDTYVSDSDWFYVMLDSHHDHLNAYQFSVNPAGVKRDERTSGGMRGDASWDAIWDVATSIDDRGWTAELRIPFSQLRFSSDEVQRWGLQLSRRISRTSEVTVLAYTPKSERGGVARYGHLEGLTQLRSGRQVELQPYVLARAEYLDIPADNPYRDGSDMFGGVGLDVKYRLTPSTTLDVTVNPDFGQVEQDPATVNLTAFETSLDERRPFFVEGNDVFAFGPSGGGPGMGGGGFGGSRDGLFYSRRIGRAPQGALPSGVSYSDRADAATILGAAKLTGRTTGGLSLGVLAALTDKESAAWVTADGLTGATLIEPRTGYFVGRMRQDLRAGQTSVGGIATLVHRQLDDPVLTNALRSAAFTGGVDFEHQFLDRTWSVDGYATMSHVRGSAASILRTQLLSSRYYARPDADHLQTDSSRTALTGFSGRLGISKDAGEHWRGGANISTLSPGYEINDGGFQTTVDRVGAAANITYVENQPGRVFRNYRINTSVSGEWNYGGDNLFGRLSTSLNGQFVNYWGGMISVTRGIDSWDDRMTRGGPVTLDPAGFRIGANINSDNRQRVSGRMNGSYTNGSYGDWSQTASTNATIRGGENWTVSLGPRYDRSRSTASYLGAATDTLMTATYGRRYFFADLRQRTVSLETRLNLNLTPDLSVEVYAQPFASSGDYGTPAQLRAPRTYAFDRFGTDIGTVAYDAETRRYTVDPDAEGPAGTFTLVNRDFSRRSLNGNAVMRWEWRAGSTLYLVWQQRRAGSEGVSEDGMARDFGRVFRDRPENVFVMKVNYWLNL